MAVSFDRAPEPDTEAATDARHEAEIQAFRQARLGRLTSATGWLTLIARHTLELGENQLPIGTVTLDAAGAVELAVPAGEEVMSDGQPVRRLALRADGEAGAHPLHHRGLVYELVRHGEHAAIRVRDPESPRRQSFAGTEWFPISLAFRVPVTLERYAEPRLIRVPYDVGPVLSRSPGQLVLEAFGRSHRLDALTDDEQKRIFLLFADETNGRETYGAGRFLYAPWPAPGSDRLTIDFNRALNPACVFTDYAVCPLPPPGNRLPVRIEAGEKLWRP